MTFGADDAVGAVEQYMRQALDTTVIADLAVQQIADGPTAGHPSGRLTNRERALMHAAAEAAVEHVAEGLLLELATSLPSP